VQVCHVCLYDCPVFAGDHRDLSYGLSATAAQVCLDFGVHGVVRLRHKSFRALYIRRGLGEQSLGELRCGAGVVEHSLQCGVGRVGGVRPFALPHAGGKHASPRGVNVIGLILTESLALSLGLRPAMQLRFGILGPHKRREQRWGE
jgi:hypothetical protein